MSAAPDFTALPIVPDPSLAAPFVDAVFRYADPDTFVALRVFPHDRTQPPPWMVDVRVGEAGKLLAEIERGIHYSAGTTDPTVFAPAMAVFAHPGTAKGRDIAEGLALIVELDQGDTRAALARLEALIGPATVLVLSGGEWLDPDTGEVHPKLHAYWRLSEPTRSEPEHVQLHDARQNAALLAGADPTGVAVVHCFRMPGSLNRKRPGRPSLCRIERLNADAEVHLFDAAEALAEAVGGAGLTVGSNGSSKGNGAYQNKHEQRADLALITTAMACIPNEADPNGSREREYLWWVRWAYAVCGATGGSTAGFTVFRTFSAKYTEKHNDAETKALWDRVVAAKPTRIGAGSIFAEAKRHGWIDSRQRRKADTKAEKSAASNGTANASGPGQGEAQTEQTGEGGTGEGDGNGGRVPLPDGPDGKGEPGGDGEGEPQPNPDWDQETGPNGEIPPPEQDAGAEAAEAEAQAQIDAVPPDDVLDAINQLGRGLTLKMLVALFNKRYAMANEGGKSLVMWSAFDPLLSRDRIERATFEDFKKFYNNRRLTVSIIGPDGEPKLVTKSFAEWWLDDPGRRQYLGGVTFAPGAGPIPHVLNLWRGWAVKPAPGDWSLMHAHIHHVICGGREPITRYVIRWLAHMVQHPDKPGEVAIVMRGLKGIGKGMFGKWILRLCGQHGLHIINAAHLTGHFLGHLRDVIFVFADEALFAGDKQHEGILKGVITEPTLLIEAKYRTPVMAANLLHLLMSSNNDWVVPATHDERRYLMLDVLATYIGDFAYFAALDAQMENGGLAAMLHDLSTMDLGDFHPRRVPDTAELGEQKMHSLESHHRWWLSVLSRGFVWKSRYGHREFLRWDEFVTTELLARSYAQWCQENRINYPASRVALGKMLAATYPASRPRTEHPVYEADSVDPDNPQPVVKAPNQMGYKVGTLDNARTLFRNTIKLADGTAEWDTPIT